MTESEILKFIADRGYRVVKADRIKQIGAQASYDFQTFQDDAKRGLPVEKYVREEMARSLAHELLKHFEPRFGQERDGRIVFRIEFDVILPAK